MLLLLHPLPASPLHHHVPVAQGFGSSCGGRAAHLGYSVIPTNPVILKQCRAGELQFGGGRAEGGCAHPEPSTGVGTHHACSWEREAPPGWRKQLVRCFEHPVLSSASSSPLSTLLSVLALGSLQIVSRCGCELCLPPSFCLPLLQPPCLGSSSPSWGPGGSRRSIFTSWQEGSLGAGVALGSQLRNRSKAFTPHL